MATRALLNPENYYEHQPKYRVWAVHFQNLKELSVKRITEIFQQYGNVKDVQQTGTSQGYCFVHYFIKDHAKKCVLNVQMDHGIKLREFKPDVHRVKVENIEKLKTKGVAKNSEESSLKNNEPVVKNNETQLANCGTNVAKPGTELKSPDFQKYYQVRSVMFLNSKRLKKSEVRTIFEQFGSILSVQQTGGTRGFCFVKFVEEQSARRCAMKMTFHEAIKLREIKAAPAREQEPESETNECDTSFHDSLLTTSYATSSSDDDDDLDIFVPEPVERTREEVISALKKSLRDVPKVIQRVTMKKDTEKTFYVPLKSRIPWRILSSVVVENVLVEPAIVANVPAFWGVDFLMELFDEFRPVYVTLMEVIDCDLRYCFIYFNDVEVMEEVERTMGEFDAFGRKVVVISPERLFKL